LNVTSVTAINIINTQEHHQKLMRGWNTAKAKYYYIKNIFQQNSNTKKFSTHRLQFKEKKRQQRSGFGSPSYRTTCFLNTSIAPFSYFRYFCPLLRSAVWSIQLSRQK